MVIIISLIFIFGYDVPEFFLKSLCKQIGDITITIYEVPTTGLRLPYTFRGVSRLLVSKRFSASGLNCRHLNPYIKLKFIELAIKLYQAFRGREKFDNSFEFKILGIVW